MARASEQPRQFKAPAGQKRNPGPPKHKGCRAGDWTVTIEVCHFPPGTSKWNKIEHRVFCHITRTWQGVPLETLEVVVKLIGSTRTNTGLEVHCWLDQDQYDKGRKVTDAEMQELFVKRGEFHGEWNYEIHPPQG